eukprot:scaffold204321_cov30-Tisochrysis_lutea.AAC.4
MSSRRSRWGSPQPSRSASGAKPHGRLHPMPTESSRRWRSWSPACSQRADELGGTWASCKKRQPPAERARSSLQMEETERIDDKDEAARKRMSRNTCGPR